VLNRVVKYQIKSSALGYAISFLLLIGLICSGVLFISSANKRLEMNYLLNDHMLLNNYLGLKYGARSNSIGQETLVHTSGDTSSILIKNWGAFRVVVSRTKHKTRFVERSAIVGYSIDQNRPALYLPNQRNVLKLCGASKLEGTVYLSDRGLERGNISGKSFQGEKLLLGEKKKSDKNLPSINSENLNFEFKNLIKKGVRIELPQTDTVFSFTNQTRFINETESISIHSSIKGNCIIHSFDSIFVSSKAVLENVILIAPIVFFESSFKGSVQVIAEKRVTCQSEVFLKYPSTIVLIEKSSDGTRENGIFLEENSKVIGGVLLMSESPNFRKPIQLRIEKAIVGGIVYNQGETELNGKIIGSIYTSKFTLNTGAGQYSNYLLDATISSKQLPSGFIAPVWLKEEVKQQAKIIICF